MQEKLVNMKDPITMDQVLEKRRKSSAKDILKKYGGSLPIMRCKICKKKLGHAEHEDVNMGICSKCTVWVHRMIWWERFLARNSK